jgi:hypothetical protein
MLLNQRTETPGYHPTKVSNPHRACFLRLYTTAVTMFLALLLQRKLLRVLGRRLLVQLLLLVMPIML